MCLRTNQREPLIAENDIVCYKVLLCQGDNTKLSSEAYQCTPRLISPFMRMEYKVGELYETTLSSDEFGNIKCGFHSFSPLFNDSMKNCWQSIQETIDWTYFTEYNHAVVASCIIPKGSSWYISDDGEEYCSNKIKICEILSD